MRAKGVTDRTGPRPIRKVQPDHSKTKNVRLYLTAPEAGPLSFLRQKETRRGRSFGLAPAFPSSARSYQALTFYPALTYGVDGDRIDSANFRIIGVGNRGLSGIVYRIKVACGR